MSNEELLCSRRKCPCGGKRILVRSRVGGFVSQNCVNGCRPRLVTPSDLPVRKCSSCGARMDIWTIDKNYAYSCPQCCSTEMVHDLVPPWQEFFQEDGVAIPGVDFDRFV